MLIRINVTWASCANCGSVAFTAFHLMGLMWIPLKCSLLLLSSWPYHFYFWQWTTTTATAQLTSATWISFSGPSELHLIGIYLFSLSMGSSIESMADSCDSYRIIALIDSAPWPIHAMSPSQPFALVNYNTPTCTPPAPLDARAMQQVTVLRYLSVAFRCIAAPDTDTLRFQLQSTYNTKPVEIRLHLYNTSIHHHRWTDSGGNMDTTPLVGHALLSEDR